MSRNDFEIAVFGGGCFWCTEAIFAKVKGVIIVKCGYAGGNVQNPTYLQVSEGNTGYAEVIQLEFDPKIISYSELLDIFWHIHNPFTLNRQGPDIGTQYRSVIFYTTDKQQEEAQKSMKFYSESEAAGNPVVTKILPLEKFYLAEEYHQNYFEKNPTQPYCQLVINPKLNKFLERYQDKLK